MSTVAIISLYGNQPNTAVASLSPSSWPTRPRWNLLTAKQAVFRGHAKYDGYIVTGGVAVPMRRHHGASGCRQRYPNGQNPNRFSPLDWAFKSWLPHTVGPSAPWTRHEMESFH